MTDSKTIYILSCEISSCMSCLVSGLETTILDIFKMADNKAMEKHRRPVYVAFEEQSVADNRDKQKAFGFFNQMSIAHVITKKNSIIPEKPRLHYNGTNRGNMIGLVAVQPSDEKWKLPFKEKREVFGSRRIAVGGPTVNMSADDTVAAERHKVLEKNRPREDDDVEPRFYHSLPPSLFEEIAHSFGAESVIDLTPGDGALAMAALELGIPYFGFCLTDEHMSKLHDRLKALTLAAMKNEKSALFEPASMKNDAGGTDDDDADDDDDGDSKAKKKRAAAKASDANEKKRKVEKAATSEIEAKKKVKKGSDLTTQLEKLKAQLHGKEKNDEIGDDDDKDGEW